MADEAPAPPPAPSKPLLVQVQKPPEPAKRDYLIDAIFCAGCGKFAHYMTSSYIADPRSRAASSDPVPVFHEECYKVRGKLPLHRPPAIAFTPGIVNEAVYRIFWSQLPDKARKPIMMDA